MESRNDLQQGPVHRRAFVRLDRQRLPPGRPPRPCDPYGLLHSGHGMPRLASAIVLTCTHPDLCPHLAHLNEARNAPRGVISHEETPTSNKTMRHRLGARCRGASGNKSGLTRRQYVAGWSGTRRQEDRARFGRRYSSPLCPFELILNAA